jgi:predicted short-subunit dehydrogenase-like oxidoreductase (DUF2520 family)
LLREGRPRVGFVGAGRTGRALATALAAAGYAVNAVTSRSGGPADALAAALEGCRAVPTPQEVADACDLVLITTPDGAIREVAESVAWRPGQAAVHVSGCETRATLAAAAARGAATGSLHPLQTFTAHGAPPDLRGVVFAVEAEGELRETLLAMVGRLGGAALELRAEEKALYHAAAVFASNYAVTLVKLATDLWLRFGWERPAALRALLPLLKGTVANLEEAGLPVALTGPIARGDIETVGRHLEALAEAAPELLPAYRELGRQTLPLALRAGGLAEERAAALRALLDGESAPFETEGVAQR